jgi:hypothetical protein
MVVFVKPGRNVSGWREKQSTGLNSVVMMPLIGCDSSSKPQKLRSLSEQ